MLNAYSEDGAFEVLNGCLAEMGRWLHVTSHDIRGHEFLESHLTPSEASGT